jgi:mevalonate kinase
VSGVGEALGAMGTKAAGGGGGGSAVQSSARAIRDAVDSVNDAKKHQAQVAEDTGRDIARAERDVSGG